MSKLFTIYDKRKERGQVSAEWYFNKGGYVATDFKSITFCHRFFVYGNPFRGTEKEFIFRFQCGIEKVIKYSWFTLELINFFEARWFYFWMKLPGGYTLNCTLNFGARVSKASRDIIGRTAVENLRAATRVKPLGGNHATANSQIRSR